MVSELRYIGGSKMNKELPTLKERVYAIIDNKTPLDWMFKARKIKKKCSCGEKAKYLFYDKLFKFCPLIGLVCSRCKMDAEHLGHSGTGYETILIEEIPKKQFTRVYYVLKLSKTLIQMSKPRQFRNSVKNMFNLYGGATTTEFAKQQIKNHKKMSDAIYKILKY